MNAAQPTARVAYACDAETQQLRLHVTNAGAPARFKAHLTIEGPLETRLEHGGYATWEHTTDLWASIETGQTYTLRVATLDCSELPFVQWCLTMAAEGRGLFEVRGRRANVAGDNSPPLKVRVIIVAEPDLAEGVHTCAVMLHASGAELLPQP